MVPVFGHAEGRDEVALVALPIAADKAKRHFVRSGAVVVHIEIVELLQYRLKLLSRQVEPVFEVGFRKIYTLGEIAIIDEFFHPRFVDIQNVRIRLKPHLFHSRQGVYVSVGRLERFFDVGTLV